MLKTDMRLPTKFSLGLLLLALPVMAADLTLQWDAPVVLPAVTNYTLYVSQQPITNKATVLKAYGVTNGTSVVVSNLNRGSWYWFVVTAREGASESGFSNQVTNQTPALPAPLNLRISP